MWISGFFSEITETEFQKSSLLTEEHVSLTASQERTYKIKKKNYKQHQEENQTGSARAQSKKTY